MQDFDQNRNTTSYTIQLTSANSSLNHLTSLSLRVSTKVLSSELIATSQDSSQSLIQTLWPLSSKLTAMSQQAFQDLAQVYLPQLPSSLQRNCDGSGLQHSLIWKDVWLYSGQATLLVSNTTLCLVNQSAFTSELTAISKEVSQDLHQNFAWQLSISLQRSCNSCFALSLTWKNVWLHSGQATLLVSSARWVIICMMCSVLSCMCIGDRCEDFQCVILLTPACLQTSVQVHMCKACVVCLHAVWLDT